MTDGGNYVAHLNMPTVKVGTKSRVNGAAVAAFIRETIGELNAHAYLEQVGAMPGGGERKSGASSMFTFGHAAGVVEGILQGMAIPYTLVTPQAWKKRAGLVGTDKDAARSRAIQLYPDLRILDLKGKGQAVADAILIARYGASCA
jgi:crossover junction endodeoxyribonuclease RuvC